MFKFLSAAVLALACAAAFAATDVNKAAGQAELETVKGIGPSMATRILEARKSGSFNNWADLQGRVKGVGDGKRASFSADGLTVNGSGALCRGGRRAGEGQGQKAPKKTAESKAKSRGIRSSRRRRAPRRA